VRENADRTETAFFNVFWDLGEEIENFGKWKSKEKCPNKISKFGVITIEPMNFLNK